MVHYIGKEKKLYCLSASLKTSLCTGKHYHTYTPFQLHHFLLCLGHSHTDNLVDILNNNILCLLVGKFIRHAGKSYLVLSRLEHSLHSYYVSQ